MPLTVSWRRRSKGASVGHPRYFLDRVDLDDLELVVANGLQRNRLEDRAVRPELRLAEHRLEAVDLEEGLAQVLAAHRLAFAREDAHRLHVQARALVASPMSLPFS